MIRKKTIHNPSSTNSGLRMPNQSTWSLASNIGGVPSPAALRAKFRPAMVNRTLIVAPEGFGRQPASGRMRRHAATHQTRHGPGLRAAGERQKMPPVERCGRDGMPGQNLKQPLYRFVIADDHPLFRGALREAVAGSFDNADIAE